MYTCQSQSPNSSPPPSPLGIHMFVLYFFFFLIFIYLFIYLWLCWVFVSVRGLSLVAASGGHSSSRCAGLSLSRPLLLRSTGSRCTGSAVVAHGPSCSAACGILPDQGSNLCPLHRQADSQPLRHQGSPVLYFFMSLSLFLLCKEVHRYHFSRFHIKVILYDIYFSLSYLFHFV